MLLNHKRNLIGNNSNNNNPRAVKFTQENMIHNRHNSRIVSETLGISPVKIS